MVYASLLADASIGKFRIEGIVFVRQSASTTAFRWLATGDADAQATVAANPTTNARRNIVDSSTSYI